MQAQELRDAFSNFWAERGHEVRPSASLIPHEPSLLFTVAGMVPFMPYFLGTEQPPSKRMTTIQKCVRVGGKHNDLDDIGRTNRHFTFFEMMGNFSFGDYFKSEAIAWAWEFVTEVLKLDAERLWVTVHVSDDDAAAIWRDEVGVPPERVQRLDADNWWAAGDKGPCGPCSEIFFDLGPSYGPDGGPAEGGEDRFVEVWNLVFMQFANDGTGELTPLDAPGIDTGAGLERLLAVLQGTDSTWSIDLFGPLLSQAAQICGRAYGEDEETDVSLRILADHARCATMLIGDGVMPSNEERGYALRRIIRRAIRHAWVLGATDAVMEPLSAVVVDVMSSAHPDLETNRQLICDVVRREEERFRKTLQTGSQILETAVGKLNQGEPLGGDVAFELHDTFGFPVELTEEILSERNLTVDRDGFEAAMSAQRERARAARAGGPTFANASYRELIDEHGPTSFVRDADAVDDAVVLAVLAADTAPQEGAPAEPLFEVYLDRTPFYAESGGQVGDVGVLITPNGDELEVVDCTYALPQLHRHVCRGDAAVLTHLTTVRAAIDAERRRRIRANHTGTHILHWALRAVLGDHVKQAGSLVEPDRLRFDFSHHEPVNDDQLRAIERQANAEILSNAECRHFETSMAEAQALGAIAFFGEKYGDTVRVLEAGAHSIELCGGTHVASLGDIGHLKIVSEQSIGSNLRRIEAVTAMDTVERMQHTEQVLDGVGDLLGSASEDVTAALRRRLDEMRDLRKQLRDTQRQLASGRASQLAGSAVGGVVIENLGELERDELRELAISVRDADGVSAVVLASKPPGGGAALVAAVDPDSGFVAAELLADAAKAVSGGFGAKGDPPVIVAGGSNPDGIDEALELARNAVDAKGASAS